MTRDTVTTQQHKQGGWSLGRRARQKTFACLGEVPRNRLLWCDPHRPCVRQTRGPGGKFLPWWPGPPTGKVSQRGREEANLCGRFMWWEEKWLNVNTHQRQRSGIKTPLLGHKLKGNHSKGRAQTIIQSYKSVNWNIWTTSSLRSLIEGNEADGSPGSRVISVCSFSNKMASTQ